MVVLVLNAGSSSLKVSLIDPGQRSRCAASDVLWSHSFDISIADSSDEQIEATIGEVLAKLEPSTKIDAVGHRVVHGGVKLVDTVFLDEDMMAEIESLSALAPLHNPPALKVVKAAMKVIPRPRHFVVFDTAFHAAMPMRSRLYPLPWSWYEEKQIMRFGFHGTSHQYCASRGAELMNKRADELLIVTAHLGNGCSLCAVRYGISCDTTMGYTPMEGLMMGSRCGSIDPGILIHVLKEGMSVDELDVTLNKQSGIAGISETGKDMRALMAARKNGDERAVLAFDVFVHRLNSGIGSMIASLGGLDALFFTGGIGENTAEVRASACLNLQWLGLSLDESLNVESSGDRIISASGSKIVAAVVEAREDLAITNEWLKLSAKS
ncbi:MAG: acetate/propionate family kinase [Candidatus Obscuribacterales bacterium]|nr:acetate/propionate family kinase [Candidatus Obscuribacterales bacterium]